MRTFEMIDERSSIIDKLVAGGKTVADFCDFCENYLAPAQRKIFRPFMENDMSISEVSAATGYHASMIRMTLERCFSWTDYYIDALLNGIRPEASVAVLTVPRNTVHKLQNSGLVQVKDVVGKSYSFFDTNVGLSYATYLGLQGALVGMGLQDNTKFRERRDSTSTQLYRYMKENFNNYMSILVKYIDKDSCELFCANVIDGKSYGALAQERGVTKQAIGIALNTFCKKAEYLLPVCEAGGFNREIPIDALYFKYQGILRMHAIGVHTCGDFLNARFKDLRSVKGFGCTRIDDVYYLLRREGVT